MTRESLSNPEWLRTVDRLGGTEVLEKEAREFGAFEKARKHARSSAQWITYDWCWRIVWARAGCD
jgi:hypothetical protein